MSNFRRGAGYTSAAAQDAAPETQQRQAGAGLSAHGLPIPNLPGNQAYNPRQWQRPKTQQLRVEGGHRGVYPERGYNTGSTAPEPKQQAKPAKQQQRPSGGVRFGEGQATKAVHLQAPKGNAKLYPPWVAYDRMVLRFFAYFQETVPEVYSERARYRKCTLLFYLEDGTLQITEPKEDNSGIPQGSFLRRHRAEKMDAPGNYIELSDLRVGEEVSVYNRVFYIYACDAATRSFMEREGYEIAEDEEAPEDQYHKSQKDREAMRTQTKAYRAKTRAEAKALDFRWITLDKQVLRFYCSWDDRKSLYGDKLPFIVHYFLSDDTVEVLEVPVKNSGREPYPMLVKRGRLPKYLYAIGPRPLSAGSRQAAKLQYYHWEDLGVGKTVFVQGRHMKIFDCDEFTRNWYKLKKGILMQPQEVTFEKPRKKPEPVIPPDILRIGREEDTRQNCLSLKPKPPQPDWQQFINCSGQVMRFFSWFVEDMEAGVLLNHESDRERRFIVSYFLVDDTVSIYEPPQRNSGIIGGKYLERSVLRKPGSRTVKYLAKDFVEGNRITSYGRVFELGEPDLYTQNYQEARRDLFPQSNLKAVLSRLSDEVNQRGLVEELRTVLIDADPDGNGRVAKHNLISALNHIGISITPAEATTLARGLDRDGVAIPSSELLTELGCGQQPSRTLAPAEVHPGLIKHDEFRPGNARRSLDAYSDHSSPPPTDKVTTWMQHSPCTSGAATPSDEDFGFQRLALGGMEDDESAPVHLGFRDPPGLRGSGGFGGGDDDSMGGGRNSSQNISSGMGSFGGLDSNRKSSLGGSQSSSGLGGGFGGLGSRVKSSIAGSPAGSFSDSSGMGGGFGGLGARVKSSIAGSPAGSRVSSSGLGSGPMNSYRGSSLNSFNNSQGTR